MMGYLASYYRGYRDAISLLRVAENKGLALKEALDFLEHGLDKTQAVNNAQEIIDGVNL